MKNYILFAAAALMLAACSNDENLDNLNGPVEIRLGSSLEVQSRAYPTQATKIIPGRAVYVWADEVNGQTDYIAAWQLISDNAGNLNPAPGDERYFPSSGENIDIYALHGSFLDNSSGEEFSFEKISMDMEVSQDQSTQAEYAKSDLLYSVAKNVPRPSPGNAERINLTFYHMLSKVEVVLLPGDGLTAEDLENAEVCIANTNVSVSLNFDKNVDMNDAADRAKMIAPKVDARISDIKIPTVVAADKSSINEYGEGIIVPQTLAEYTPFIRITTAEGGELVYKIPVGGKIFESGKKYTYIITANLTELGVVASISDWTAGTGDDDGVAGME